MEGFREKMTPLVQAVLQAYSVPGLSVAVVHDGAPVWVGGAGSLQQDGPAPVTETTRFCIGSLTKAFTAAAVVSVLQHRRDVTLDTPVTSILGEEVQFCDEFRTKHATLRDLLAHKMGYELGESDMVWAFNPLTREELMSNLKYLPATSGLREKFYYNNIMYTVAGVVAEKLSGQTWEELVTNCLLQPIGMQDTGFIDKEAQPINDLAKPHLFVGPEKKLTEIDTDLHRGVGFLGPCGSIISSARDMVRWMQFHLNEGSVDTVPIVSPAHLKQCHKPQFALPSGKPEWDGFISRPQFPVTETRDTYGFGWYHGTYRGYQFVAHSGELFGYDSLVTLYPDLKIGIYTCTNGPGGEGAFLANQLLQYCMSDILMKEEMWLDKTTICTFPQPWTSSQLFQPDKIYIPIETSLQAVRPLNEYTGTYKHQFLGEATVLESETEQNALMFKYGKVGEFCLYPDGEPDEFQMKGAGLVDFLTEADMFSPTTWMTVKFVSADTIEGTDCVTALHCALFEGGPKFTKQA